MTLRRHPSLGVLYECLEIEDLGPDADHPGNRAIRVHVAMHVGAEVRLLGLHRTVTAPRLAELREGLTS